MLPIGKLDTDLLNKLIFRHLGPRRPEVLLRAALGEDCAVLDPAGDLCVLSTDPITGAAEIIGSLAVHVNCNDIAAQGIAPVALMLTILAPAGTEASELELVMRRAAAEAAKLNVEIIGGHTEITSAVNRMVVSGVALGFKPKDSPVPPAKPGDHLIMTKTAGLEGTGIILSDFSETLKNVLSSEELAQSPEFFSALSVVPEGVLGGRFGASKLHDITEGGILGAVWEVCHAVNMGCVIQKRHIPVHPLTEKVCTYFDIDPYRLISSGAMLLILPPEKSEAYIAEAASIGVRATVIGELTASPSLMVENDGLHVLDPPGPDELFKVVG